MATNKPTNVPGEKESAVQDQNSFNGPYTAIPKSISSAGAQDTDLELYSTPMDAGEMNEKDAIESGYVSTEDAEAPEGTEHSPHIHAPKKHH
jgi:hypothetical protein